MTATEVMARLANLGSAQTKKTFVRHGAKEPLFGVKVADLKVLQKQIKKDHALALELYDTGNSDAMYLAGLIADRDAFTKPQLQKWAEGASWHMLSGTVVAASAAESRFGRELARAWIDHAEEQIANAGWCTYGFLVAIKHDDALDLPEIEKLMTRASTEIGSASNRVRYSMNGFVISVGSYVAPLLAKAKAAAKRLGTVEVDVGDTDCKVPNATEYIAKVESMGRVGKKRKRAGC